MNPLTVTIAATLLLAVATTAAWTAERWGHGPRWATTCLAVASLAGCTLTVLLVAVDETTVDWDRLTPDARTLYAAGFYAGVLILAGLALAVATAPWWMDRHEARQARNLTDRHQP